MIHVDSVIGGLALSAVAAALVTDIGRNKIYNWLTLPLMVLGPIVQLYRHGWPGLGYSLLGFIGVSFALFLLFSLIGRGLGGGDIKLMVALGAVLGWPTAGWLLLYTALSGPILALPVMLSKGIVRVTFQNLLANLLRRCSGERDLSVDAGTRGPKLPFAICAMLGLLAVMFIGPLQ